MKDLGLKVKMKRRYKNITDSNHNLPKEIFAHIILMKNKPSTFT
jgi:hypothetical protein